MTTAAQDIPALDGERQARAQRAQGTAFAMAYAPRATPKACTAPGKRGPKPKKDQSYLAKTLRAL